MHHERLCIVHMAQLPDDLMSADIRSLPFQLDITFEFF